MRLSFAFLINCLIAGNSLFAGNQNQDSLRKHSLNLTLSPLAFASWTYPEYQVIPDQQDYGFFQNRNHPVSFWPIGITYKHRFLTSLKVEIGIIYSLEKNKIRANYYENGIHRIKDINYRQDFLQIPFSVVIFPIQQEK